MGTLGSSVAVDIACTYVVVTNSGSATTKLVDSLLSLDAAGGNQINIWTHATSVNVAVNTTAGTTGVSSDWAFSFIPNNANVGVPVDGHLKFKVNQTLPKGTILQITFPDNIGQAFGTGNINNDCFSKISYTECSVTASSRLQMTIAEDVTALNFIELYVTLGYNMPANTSVSGSTF